MRDPQAYQEILEPRASVVFKPLQPLNGSESLDPKLIAEIKAKIDTTKQYPNLKTVSDIEIHNE